MNARRHDTIKSLLNNKPVQGTTALYSQTYYSIKSPVCCHCATNTRNTNCRSYNKLGKFGPVKEYIINKQYKMDMKGQQKSENHYWKVMRMNAL